MKALSTFFGIIIGLALLAALFAGCYYLFKYAVEVFGTLEPQLATLTVIASIVAIFCTSIIAGGLKAATKQDISSSASLDRADLYKQLLSQMIERLNTSADLEVLETDNELVDLEHLLALHGSPKVISAYMELRRSMSGEAQQGSEVSALLNKLVKEMRGDLNRPLLIFKENDLLDLLLRRY